ncbi:E3 ubiquitin/ISG15 ligase TRIM25-like [Chiloscyllium punctatum]|uniref:E3 ubiquitin/ISG15 ligase TRIM25-like n=1 Tax=Chiloscyllium punctatum TaxID=137246 RepID=UPI003B6396BF
MATGLAQEALGEELTCAICLEIYTDPVILDCKHSFCQSCIEETWNDTAAAPYCCPECRAEYTERPGLERNFKLANIVQKYLALEVSQDAVLCNYCTEKIRPAVKTCLKCDASMCPEHLRHHTESTVFKSHLLVDPTADVSQWKCTEHQELLKIYCKEDKVCVCTLCTVFGKHKGHNCGSISEGEKELRNHLQHQLQKIRNNVEAVHLALSDLHKEKKNAQSMKKVVQMKIKAKYETLRKHIDKEERRILRYLESEQSRVTTEIDVKICNLEKKVKDFEKSFTDLSDLLKHNEDLVFIQGLNSMADRMKDASEPFIAQIPNADINVSVVERLSEWVQQQYITAPQPALGRNFLVSMYGQTPTLDPHTAFPHLILSDSNRSVSGSKRQQPYSDSPKRFNYWWQILCTERLSYGRCYWEVEIGGDRRRWDVGMCYESLSRKGKGKECSLGQNKESWCLYSEPGSLAALYDNNATKLTAQMPTRVGVYVDFEAGIISFYSVSDRKLTLLHNFREQTFTKPLYPALGVADFTTSLALCGLK